MTDGAPVARIEDVRFTATHDGELALVAILRFPNGGRSRIQVLDHDLACVMQRAGVGSAGELIGKPWTVLDILDD